VGIGQREKESADTPMGGGGLPSSVFKSAGIWTTTAGEEPRTAQAMVSRDHAA